MSYGKLVRQIGAVTTIPMLLVAGILVGFWMGSWIDQKFSWDPWGKTVLALLGFGAGVKQSIQIIKNWIKESENETDDDVRRS